MASLLPREFIVATGSAELKKDDEEKTVWSIQCRKCEEIVRCRDCVHFDAYGNTFGFCAFHDIDCSERRFCAWGERKEGGE